MRFYISLLVLFVLVTIAFVFGSQNTQLVELNYLIARSEITVATAVSLFTILGFFIGVLTTITFQVYRALTKKKKLKYSQPNQE